MRCITSVFLFILIIIINKCLGDVSNSKSFRQCLEYNRANGSTDDLIPAPIPKKPIKYKFVNRSGDSSGIIDEIFLGGGDDAELGQFPFMAALEYGNETKKEYFCGGTLISERFVLTAAHCIFSRTGEAVKSVHLGDVNLNNFRNNYGVQIRRVQEFYVHPNYTYPAKYHDIALLKLDEPITISERVSPACLDFSRDESKYYYLYATGWGATGYGERQSDYLQFGKLARYHISRCRRTFPKDLTLPIGIDDETQICAGAGDRLVDTCEGDSGGPLAHSFGLNNKQIHFVIGVTSFGKSCLLDRIPAVYSRVSYYVDWIENIVWPEKTKVIKDKIFFPSD